MRLFSLFVIVFALVGGAVIGGRRRPRDEERSNSED